MTVTYLGGQTIAGIVPGAAAAFDAAIPDLRARLDALLEFAPVQGNFTANINLAQQTIAALQGAIALGITPPSIASQLAEVAAQISDLEGRLSAAIGFLDGMAVGGFHLYHYTGDVNDLGSDFSAELSGGFPGGSGSDNCNALLIGTSSGASWAGLGAVFKTS